MQELYYFKNEVKKRFLVYAFDTYYPSGWDSDLVGDFDTIDEALECFKNEKYDHKAIFDRLAGLEIDATKYGLEY
jgi:hypothetical protein